jgi:alpha-glucosidase (family GH31 glycosyl hydrolase)
MVLVNQDDKNTHTIYDQYYFGKSILVAPMLTTGDTRDVYLPEGVWYDFWTGNKMEKSGWISVKAPLDTMPMFVEEGTIIPFGEEVSYVDEKSLEVLQLHVYGHVTCSLNYVNGEISNTFKVKLENGNMILDKGNYKGKFMLKVKSK